MFFYGKSDIGRIRKTNQDSFLTKRLANEAVLGVVCDGMGGVNGGNIASGIAVETFAAKVEDFIRRKAAAGISETQISEGDYTALLARAVVDANHAVYSKASASADLRGMGTTLVAALVVKNNLYIVNIGDSRLYVTTDSSITQITKDHSLVQYLLDSGKLTPAEAQNYPKKNIITRAVGIEMDIEADIFSVNLAGTRKGYILLCSDGLTNFVKLEEISSIVTAPAASDADIPTLLEQKAANLINRANEAGGSDNITAVLIEYNSSN